MIIYNNRYRGSFEHDKFALNILGFHNIINSLESVEFEDAESEFITLKNIKTELDNLFESFTKENGTLERMYLLAIKERKCLR